MSEHVIDNNGLQLNAKFSVEIIHERLGLVLASRSGTSRNSDYTFALEILLDRCRGIGLETLHVYVVSKLMLQACDSIDDLGIEIEGRRDIPLQQFDAVDLRHRIGREQKDIRVDPHSQKRGNNRNKRILLHSPSLDAEFWHRVATTPHLSKKSISSKTPSEVIRGSEVSSPLEYGSITPKAMARTSIAYLRDSDVVNWVLAQAKGICEFCQSNAPFLRADGTPYLEVHHVLPLAKGGSDTIKNTVAICPNCHRRLHHGLGRTDLIDKIIESVERLEDERT